MDDTDDEDELSLQSMEGDMDQSPEQLAAIVQVKVDLSVDKVRTYICMYVCTFCATEVLHVCEVLALL